ncbi:MAG TPA: CHAD domain-containing protein [Acidimicrobiales bacterium]|nr:CHAD domain-containing protein [Acidimicrobiales bacterium]
MSFGWGEAVWNIEAPTGGDDASVASRPPVVHPPGEPGTSSMPSRDDVKRETPVPELPPLGADPDTGDVARTALAKAVAHFVRHDHPTSFGVDPESVHQARVALRRVRSYVRTFRPVLDAQWAMEIRSEAAWYAADLGGVRDLDVLGERVARDGGDLGDTGLLSELLQGERDEALRRLTTSALSPRHDTLVEHLLSAADPPLRRRASRPASKGCPPLLIRAWRDFKEAGREAEHKPDDVRIHALRIRAKRLRYTADATSPALGPSVGKIASAAATLQDRLGVLHDAVVLQSWLEDRSKTHLECAFEAGKLWAREADLVEIGRSQWHKEMRGVRKRWRGWRRRG